MESQEENENRRRYQQFLDEIEGLRARLARLERERDGLGVDAQAAVSDGRRKPRHVLDGYKVLDFTQVLAGPTVTRLMAEMGAEIIKVELAPEGDFSRGLPFLKDGRSGFFVQQNRGKKSLCVDVKKPAGLAIIKALLPQVDVLVENFAPGVLGRMGLGYETVRQANPRIVMCSISALGQSGELASEPGYDYIGQAYAGVTDLIGDPNGLPSVPILGLGDVSTGVHAMGAIACALLYREHSGRGQYLDISILDAYFHCHELSVQVLSASRGAMVLKRGGPQNPFYAPGGVFQGKQGPILIAAVFDHQWTRLCEVMGQPELAQDSRYATNAKRRENQKEVVQIVQIWLDSTTNDEETMAQLRANRIPMAPVLSVGQAINHPHLRARHTVRTIRDRVLGEFDIPGFPLKFSEFAEELPLEAPFLGEHNGEVLRKYLGYTAELIKGLESDGTLRREGRAV